MKEPDVKNFDNLNDVFKITVAKILKYGLNGEFDAKFIQKLHRFNVDKAIEIEQSGLCRYNSRK